MKTNKDKTKHLPVSKSSKPPKRDRGIESRDLNSDEQKKITNAPVIGNDKPKDSDEEG